MEADWQLPCHDALIVAHRLLADNERSPYPKNVYQAGNDRGKAKDPKVTGYAEHS